MHELGIVHAVVESVREAVGGHGLVEVDAVVLQVGELSSVVPKYLEECWPAAVDGTEFTATKLRIEILPGRARCDTCGREYDPLREGNGACPACEGRAWTALAGKEFLIKELIAR